MIEDLEGDLAERETESDRKAREFRKLQEARAAIDQRLKQAAEKSAYDAWRRLIARPTLMIVAQALGNSKETMKRWLTETSDMVSDGVSDGRISSNARRRLQAVFFEVAHLNGWTL
jgi:phage-related minor tail protein